jgi:hypothetical protein
MMKIRANTIAATALIASLAAPATSFACASCGCTLSSDWSQQGLATMGGWSFDLRYDLINQNEWRSGTSKIAPAVAAQMPNNAGEPAEIEEFTKTQTINLGVDYASSAGWGVSLTLPYLRRTHATYGSASEFGLSDGYPDGTNGYRSSTNAIGDAKLVGRYFDLAEERNWGVLLGLKLPTGSNTQTGTANDGSGATVIDPGLQPGTRTTDLLIGVYGFANPKGDWNYFGQAMYQAAIDSAQFQGASYKPGNSLNINLGARYSGWSAVVPNVQLNARFVERDSGDAADVFATGGTLVYLSPGLIATVSDKVSVYGNLQVPIYQKVNGFQLTPRTIVSIGTRFSF